MTESSMFDLTGKAALVTGASSGFGAHFAKTLAQHGAKVTLAARRVDRLRDQVREIEEAGGTARAAAMDVTDSASVAEAFAQAEEAFGPAQVVSNNAGVADARPALHIEEEAWDRVLETNLKGAWRVAMETGRRLIEAKLPGSLVNTASILGLRPAMGQSSYATSKAALIQLTRTLALEWSRHHIRVNALCPGYFVTEINREFLESDKGQAYLRSTPAGRSGNLPEITAPFMLLASDAGAFVNGVALPVDGAHSLGNF